MKLAGLFRSTSKASAEPVGYNANLWQRLFSAGAENKADIHVDECSALKLTTVYSCVKVIADTIAHLPVHVKNGGEKQNADPRHYLLHTRPNPMMGAFIFYQTLISHKLLWGNAYAEIQRISGGDKVVGLHIVHPSYVKLMKDDGGLFYQITINNVEYRKELADMIHIKNLGHDGLVGISSIALHKNAVRLGLEMEQFGNEFFKSSASVGGFLSHPKTLSDESRIKMADSWNKRKKRGVVLLEEDMKFTPNSIPPEDAQFLESRTFQVIEIARIFKVPPVLVYEQSKNTSWGSGIEQTMLGFYKLTLQPIIVQIEQEFNYKMFTQQEQLDGLKSSFSMGGLLRGDMTARASYYRTMYDVGALSSNEIREFEDREPYEGGNQFRAPLNTEKTGVLTNG